MPIDGPVDHTGGRAGADGAESAAGRRGRRLRGRCVFARGAHRPVPAPAPAETARPEAKEEKAPKTEEGKAEEEICPAGYPDDPRPCKARPAGAGSLSAAAACAAAAAGVCLRRVGPYDTALAFGYVNAALGALTPLAERALRIDERDIQTGVDFQAERPRIDARIVCTIRIGQIVIIALAFGAGFLKQKMHAKQARAARAKTAPATQERKVSNG